MLLAILLPPDFCLVFLFLLLLLLLLTFNSSRIVRPTCLPPTLPTYPPTQHHRALHTVPDLHMDLFRVRIGIVWLELLLLCR